MEDPFLLAAAAAPHDQTLRTVYADWFEERGDPRGEFIRIQVRLLRMVEGDPEYRPLLGRKEELRAQIDVAWLRQMGYAHETERTARAACERPKCPAEWNLLRPTENSDVRFCELCREHVHYCSRSHEIRDQLQRGHVVAVPPRNGSWEWARLWLTQRTPTTGAQSDPGADMSDASLLKDLEE